MLAELRKARFPVETGLLLAFCLFLPLLEFWKNLFLVSYAIAWVVNRMRARDFGGPWRTSDSVAALWLGCAYLAAVFAGLEGRALAKTGDVAASAVLFWMASRAGYSRAELTAVLGAIVLSTLAGLLHGYWRIEQMNIEFDRLQLHSVGHVNHSGIEFEQVWIVVIEPFGLHVSSPLSAVPARDGRRDSWCRWRCRPRR